MKLQTGVSFTFGTSPYEVESTGEAKATGVLVGSDSSLARPSQQPSSIVLEGSLPQLTTLPDGELDLEGLETDGSWDLHFGT